MASDELELSSIRYDYFTLFIGSNNLLHIAIRAIFLRFEMEELVTVGKNWSGSYANF